MSLRSPTYRSTLSIALISSVAAVQLTGGAVAAEEHNSSVGSPARKVTQAIPEIGNTYELDRAFSREVNDSFVFGSDTPENDISDQKEHMVGAAALCA